VVIDASCIKSLGRAHQLPLSSKKKGCTFVFLHENDSLLPQSVLIFPFCDPGASADRDSVNGGGGAARVVLPGGEGPSVPEDLRSPRTSHGPKSQDASESQDSCRNTSLRPRGSLQQAAACPPHSTCVPKETCSETALSGEVFGWDSSRPDVRHLQDWCLDLS